MRLLVAILAVMAAGTVGAYLPAVLADGLEGDPFRAAVTLTHAPLALLLVARAQRQAAASWLGLLFALFAMGGVVSITRYVAPPAGAVFATLTLVPIAVAGGALVRFATTLTDDERPLGRARLILKRPMALSALLAASYLVLAALARFGIGTRALAESVVFVWLLLAASIACGVLGRAYSTDVLHRATSVRWCVLAIVLWSFGALTFLGWVWLDAVGAFHMPWAAGMSVSIGSGLIGSGVLTFGVLFRGIVDPSLAVRRTVLVGGLVVGSLFVFGGLEAALSDLLLSRSGMPPGLSMWVSAGAIGVLLHPVGQWLSHRVDGVFERLEIGRQS